MNYYVLGILRKRKSVNFKIKKAVYFFKLFHKKIKDHL